MKEIIAEAAEAREKGVWGEVVDAFAGQRVFWKVWLPVIQL